MVDLEQGVEVGTGGGYYLVVFAVVVVVFFLFFFHLCFCPLFSHVLCPFVLSD